MKCRKMGGLLLSAMMALTPVSVLAADGFTDVEAGAWYIPYVNEIVEKGLMNGIGNNQFAPNSQLTRAEFAQIIWNNFMNKEVSGTEPFRDTAGTWYEDAATFCRQYDFITGYADGSFGGDDLITRQQMITILNRVSKKTPWLSFVGGVSDSTGGPLDRFPDRNEVADWAEDAMIWGVLFGIIGGSDYLRPNGITTRAEAAKMLAVWKHYATTSMLFG